MHCPSALLSWHAWISHICACPAHTPSLYLHTKAPPLTSPRLNFLMPLQNSRIIKLPSSKESWLGNISENLHGYCKHSIMPKGNPSNGNFHSWHPSSTSLCFLLPWLTSNDLMCRRWDYWSLPSIMAKGQLSKHKLQILIFWPKKNDV